MLWQHFMTALLFCPRLAPSAKPSTPSPPLSSYNKSFNFPKVLGFLPKSSLPFPTRKEISPAIPNPPRPHYPSCTDTHTHTHSLRPTPSDFRSSIKCQMSEKLPLRPHSRSSSFVISSQGTEFIPWEHLSQFATHWCDFLINVPSEKVLYVCSSSNTWHQAPTSLKWITELRAKPCSTHFAYSLHSCWHKKSLSQINSIYANQKIKSMIKIFIPTL